MEQLKKQLLDAITAEPTVTESTDYSLGREYSAHAQACRLVLPQWDTSVSPWNFDNLSELIRMDKWTKDDFNLTNENMVRKYLPDFMVDVFFRLKDFRSNSRNELVSTVEDYAVIMGWPKDTQDEKAFCTFRYELMYYLDNSRLNGGSNE